VTVSNVALTVDVEDAHHGLTCEAEAPPLIMMSIGYLTNFGSMSCMGRFLSSGIARFTCTSN